MTSEEVLAFERCIRRGAVAIFPTDTLYGIGCRPGDDAALARVYGLKGRAPEKPSATMWFRLDAALDDLGKLGSRTRAALEKLLPGPVLAVMPSGVGVRVPLLEGSLAPLAAARVAVVQTSANRSGEPAPRRLQEVPPGISEGAEVMLDGGTLPGVPSTVVDLTHYERDGAWRILREGALKGDVLSELLGD